MEFASTGRRQTTRTPGWLPNRPRSTNSKQEAGMIWNFLRGTSRWPALFAGTALVLSLSIAPANAQKAQPGTAGSGDLTGAPAHTGLAKKRGIDAAVDEINEGGGVLGKKLRVIAYDDRGDPPRAVDNARRIGERDNCI